MAISLRPASVDIALARARGHKRLFEWQPLASAAFERARRERRYVLLNGAAEWRHWCHVMDATTYKDPNIGRILRERFVTIRVDVDARPDIEERYGDWGWPATILFSPDGKEIGKFRDARGPGAPRTGCSPPTWTPTAAFAARRRAPRRRAFWSMQRASAERARGSRS